MTAPLPLMTESEVRSCTVDGGERGYGCLRTDRGPLPLKEMTIDARVIATFAHTTLRQVFVNNYSVPLEATYIFPLPDRAGVTRFTMEVAGRRVEGQLEERMQARRTYDAAIAQGKRASIAEEERAGVFTIRVGNLMPGEAAAITLEMSGALPVADGEVTYRFPLVVAPRYMPGQILGGDNVGDGIASDTDAVPDASRISPPVILPGYASPVRLGVSVELDSAGLPMSSVRSSLHAAYADNRAGRLVVQLPPGERLDRDFILRFHLGDAAMHTSARTVGDTFALTLLPPTMQVTHKPKDVVFVLDRSGSMEGWKMVAARRACARMIDALRPMDRFHVLAFDNVVEELPLARGASLVEATDRNRYQATEWLGKVEARGGTEMAAPLARAADMLGGGYLERDRVLVFVTDGQVGNEAQLMKLLGQRLKGARVFPVGIDQAVNAGFLNKLASLGRAGTAELIESEERLDEVLMRLHRRVDAPVLAELSLDVVGGQLQQGTLAPAQLPDVFPGIPATIFGKLAYASGGATFIVRGRLADGRSFEERIPAHEVGNPAVRTAWARLHLRDLEDRFDAGQGDKRQLERRIVEVSLQNGVLCRFTAFVAVDHEVVNRGGYNHQVTQAVEQPAGWGAAGSGSVNAPQAEAFGGRARRVAAPMNAGSVLASKSVAAPAPAPEPMCAEEADGLFESEAREQTRGISVSSLADDEAPMEPAMPAAPAPAPRAPMRQEKFDAGADMSRAAKPAPRVAKKEAAEKRKDKPGFFGSVKDAIVDGLSGKGQAAPASLAQFRDRIADLVELARKKASDLWGVARELEQRLRLLLEDMAHAGVDGSERRSLEDAHRLLKDAIDGGDSLFVERALETAESVLDRAAGGVAKQPPGAGGRREGFWR